MRVWFSIIPGHGHFFPMLPLARALQAAGHDVAFATADSYGATIRDHGFDAIAIGLDYTQIGKVAGSGDDAELEKLMFVDGPPAVVRDALEAFADGPPDVVLADPTDFAIGVAAEVAGIPWGCVLNGIVPGMFAGTLPFDLDERAAALEGLRLTKRLRADAGLPPLDLLESERPYDRTLRLTMVPPSLEGWPLEWASHTVHQLRPEVHVSDSDDAWLDELPTDRPVVAVSFGTLFGTPDLYAQVLEQLRGRGATIVVVSSFDLGIDDPDVLLTRWVSMDRLLERSDVVVHHGGWGSTIAGLITGTPAIVVPLGADQFVNAARLVSVGAARQVDVSGIGDQLGPALRSVLDEPVYRLNAERLAAEIAAMPAAADVVRLVERLAEDGPPILNR